MSSELFNMYEGNLKFFIDDLTSKIENPDLLNEDDDLFKICEQRFKDIETTVNGMKYEMNVFKSKKSTKKEIKESLMPNNLDLYLKAIENLKKSFDEISKTKSTKMKKKVKVGQFTHDFNSINNSNSITVADGNSISIDINTDANSKNDSQINNINVKETQNNNNILSKENKIEKNKPKLINFDNYTNIDQNNSAFQNFLDFTKKIFLKR
jgi:hypothetical protein